MSDNPNPHEFTVEEVLSWPIEKREALLQSIDQLTDTIMDVFRPVFEALNDFGEVLVEINSLVEQEK